MNYIGEILIVSGFIWGTYNFFNKSYVKYFNKSYVIFPTYMVDIDTIILSFVDKEILSHLSVNKYLANIIDSPYFWRVRMENKIGLKSDNILNYRCITNLFDNNQSLSENVCHILHHRYRQQIFDLLAENQIYGYFFKQIENKNLENTFNTIYKNIFRPPNQPKYDLTAFNIFYNQLKTNNQFTYVYINCITTLIKVKITVYFEGEEDIIIKCNRPMKLMILLYELSRVLSIKKISISNTDNHLINLFYQKLIKMF